MTQEGPGGSVAKAVTRSHWTASCRQPLCLLCK